MRIADNLTFPAHETCSAIFSCKYVFFLFAQTSGSGGGFRKSGRHTRSLRFHPREICSSGRSVMEICIRGWLGDFAESGVCGKLGCNLQEQRNLQQEHMLQS